MTLSHFTTAWRPYALGFALILGLTVAVVAVRAYGLEELGFVQGAVDGAHVIHETDAATRYTVINGWAAPTQVADALATVRVTKDAGGYDIVDEFQTNIARQDVYNALGTMLHVGFSWRLPSSHHDGQTRTYYFWGVRTMAGQTMTQPIGQWTVGGYDGHLRGSVDAVMGTVIQGWAFDLDGEDVAGQALPVSIYIDGEYVASTLANIERQDLVSAFSGWSVGAWHGYNVSLNIPARFRDGGMHGVEVFGLEATEGRMTKIGETYYRVIDVQGTMSSGTPTL